MIDYCTLSLRRKFLRNTLLAVFLLFGSSFTFSQNVNAEIDNLLAQREQLIQSSQSTTDVDKQLFDLGYRPKAQVTVSGNQISFPTFLPVSPAKQAVMENRIKSVNPTLSTLVLIESTQVIQATFTEAPTTQNIYDIIVHFGFNSYETH